MAGALAALLLLGRLAQAEAAAAARKEAPAIRLYYRGWRPKRPKWVHRLAFFVLAFAGSRVAAQDAQPQTPVNLFEPETGNGIAVGPTFTLYPEVTVQGIYDTNIYNLDSGAEADMVMSLRPRFVFVSDFVRHQFEISGSADIRRYAKYSGENSTTAEVRSKALLELGGWIYVQPAAAFVRGVDMRGTAGDQFFSDSPVAYDRKEAQVSIWRSQHRLGVSLNARATRTDYQDTTLGGVPIDLSDRDVSTLDGSAQFDLAISERVKLYTKVSVNELSYQAPALQRLGSSGYALLAGARIRITQRIDTEVAVGYIRQDFDDPTFKPVSAADYHVAASITPQPSWKITAGADRVVDPSPRNDAPAIFRSSYHLTAQHSVSDRLILEAKGQHVEEAYRGIERIDRRLEAGVSAQYRLTDNLGVTGAFGYRHQSGGTGGRNYDGVSASVSLRAVI